MARGSQMFLVSGFRIVQKTILCFCSSPLRVCSISINTIEDAQINVTKLVGGLKNLDYESRDETIFSLLDKFFEVNFYQEKKKQSERWNPA